MIYHSKKDWWLVAVIVMVGAIDALICVAGIYNLLAPGGNAQAGWLMVAITIVSGALILGLTYPLYYEITPSDLNVRSGFLRWQIPLGSIDELHPTNNPLGSPALSLDRLRVDYRKDGKTRSILISPEDKAKFMRELAASGTGLEVRGERVIRVA